MGEIVERIKGKKWEKRVRRAGFLQAKDIASEALTKNVKLTEDVTVSYENIFCVDDQWLYDDVATKKIVREFAAAFLEDSNWPLEVIKFFDNVSVKVDALVKKLTETDWSQETKENRLKVFMEYVNLMMSFQKFYAIAVPLTDYCEEMLKNRPDVIREHAVAYKPLEMNGISKSENPVKDFAWIKTTYSIIHEVRPSDFKDMKEERYEESELEVPAEIEHYVTGLQVGIYIRNRIKELSQKLWYYVEKLALNMANDLWMMRDDFYNLTWNEIKESYKKGELVVSKDEIKKRKEGFGVGFVDNEKILITGDDVKEINNWLRAIPDSVFIKGSVACKGKVQAE